MILMIVGSRNFNNYQVFKNVLNKYRTDDLKIISGGCYSGADKFAEDYAKEFNIPIQIFPADWNKHGRAAGPIRNEEMIKATKELNGKMIAFWDGKSRGTKNDIDLAKRYEVAFEVYDFNGKIIKE